MILHSPHVYVRETGTGLGRGSFAARAFKCGEPVERCAVILIDGAFPDLPPAVRTLVFDWETLAGDSKYPHALALGFGSLYNHANPANMRYDAQPKERTLTFTAVRDIIKDEQLTVNYNALGGGAEWPNDNWFQRTNIQRL